MSIELKTNTHTKIELKEYGTKGMCEEDQLIKQTKLLKITLFKISPSPPHFKDKFPKSCNFIFFETPILKNLAKDLIYPNLSLLLSRVE